MAHQVNDKSEDHHGSLDPLSNFNLAYWKFCDFSQKSLAISVIVTEEKTKIFILLKPKMFCTSVQMKSHDHEHQTAICTFLCYILWQEETMFKRTSRIQKRALRFAMLLNCLIANTNTWSMYYLRKEKKNHEGSKALYSSILSVHEGVVMNNCQLPALPAFVLQCR